MLNISKLRLQILEDGVQATSVARAELTTKVAEFKKLGPDARAIVFGSHRKPQAVIVPIDLFNELLDLAEGVITTPRAVATSNQAKLANKDETVQNQEDSEISADHVASETQRLLNDIMSKWKL